MRTLATTAGNPASIKHLAAPKKFAYDLLGLNPSFKLQEGQALIIDATGTYRSNVWEDLLKVVQANPKKVTVNISEANLKNLGHCNFAWMKILQHKQAHKVEVNVIEDNGHSLNSSQAA